MLPDDPSDQLELAHRIANLAFVSKVQQLERENANLREQNADVKMKTKQLERKVLNLENELAEAADKAVLAMEERDKLHAEKTALINTVKKLNREVAKLDNFKRNLMQTLRTRTTPSARGTRRAIASSPGCSPPPPRGCPRQWGGRHGCRLNARAQLARAKRENRRRQRGVHPRAIAPRRCGSRAVSRPGGFSGGGSGLGSAASSPLGWRIRWTERSSSDARGRG